MPAAQYDLAVFFAAAFGSVDGFLRGALLARFLVAALVVLAGGRFVVFFVAIGTPEASTLSESRILATKSGLEQTSTK